MLHPYIDHGRLAWDTNGRVLYGFLGNPPNNPRGAPLARSDLQ